MRYASWCVAVLAIVGMAFPVVRASTDITGPREARPTLCSLRAIPKGTKIPRPVARPSKPEETDYEHMLRLYLKNIGRMNAERQERERQSYLSAIQQGQEKKAYVEKNHDDLLRSLESKASASRDGKLSLDMSSDTNEVVSPSSDASGEIFGALIDKGMIDTDEVLSRVLSYPIVSKGWLGVAGKAAATEKTGSPAWIDAVKLLYRAGESREKYRAVLEQMVKRDNSVSSLGILITSVDAGNGKPSVVIDHANDALMKYLSVSNPSPEILALCVKYDLAGGHKAEAEDIGLKILAKRYKETESSSVGDDSEPLQADIELGRAKSMIMETLFFGSASEKVFKAIYDTSHAMQTESILAEEGKLPKGYKGIGSSGFGRLEVNYAKGFINEVRIFDRAE